MESDGFFERSMDFWLRPAPDLYGMIDVHVSTFMVDEAPLLVHAHHCVSNLWKSRQLILWVLHGMGHQTH